MATGSQGYRGLLYGEGFDRGFECGISHSAAVEGDAAIARFRATETSESWIRSFEYQVAINDWDGAVAAIASGNQLADKNPR